ncbi:multiheme c-type cytochrome [Sphingomonas sp. BIUV-7]|uniref:Multiheme c-type cytochrome n=1 Tax=Sphingomonas natans TaxID=3063330 RepID=A0ABT8Y5G2_9SPHN|nr:multiheme c-type cytochrome [Sphingomonas sp. BIUV-7]MDO6412949.1 multiheme c-type cytochrome [Sphingomonas sp. BIUV-7]
MGTERIRTGRIALIALAIAAVLVSVILSFGGVKGDRAEAATHVVADQHLGVASCAGTTCHGRQEGDGAVVRQDEILRWQDESSQAGAHSRAWRVLGEPRGLAIGAKLGIGNPQNAAECLGCHADPAPNHGARWTVSDGVGCEACHGPASGNWLTSHYAVGATHAKNASGGLFPIDQPSARADRCLDCHFGSGRDGQFVDHRIMAAGHPRIAFELDLFTTLEQHWNEDADYTKRKGMPSTIKTWAVGQAAAVQRALSVYSGPRGTAGVAAEPYFFDCHSCHRRISDDADFRPTAIANPERPMPVGAPPFQDENMIMLSAAARVVAPAEGQRFDAAARGFHASLAQGRPQALAAAGRLKAAAASLESAMAARSFSTSETLAIVAAVAGEGGRRYTDYEASAQAVMSLDTLLNALVKQGAVSQGQARSVRGPIDAAYRAVRDPNAYKPLEFRAAIQRAASAVGALR